MFGTYRPRDYRGLVDEYLAAQQKRVLPPEKTVVEQKPQPPANKAAASVSSSMPLLNRLYVQLRSAPPGYTVILALMILAFVALL